MKAIDAKEQVIKEIRDRIQFLITVEIFFSTLTYTFFKSIGSDEALANTNALFWGIGVAFCIINYLIIGKAKEVTERGLNWIRNTITLNIALFILPIILFALVAREPAPAYYKWPFIVSFNGSIWMPIVTFAFIIGAMVWAEVQWVRKIFKK